jgi:hypothetical protein
MPRARRSLKAVIVETKLHCGVQNQRRKRDEGDDDDKR